MCECFQVGGPFISEDPDCPVHGVAAQSTRAEVDDLRAQIDQTDDIEELRRIAHKIADAIDLF